MVFLTHYDKYEESEDKWIAWDAHDLNASERGVSEDDAIENLIASQLRERTVH